MVHPMRIMASDEHATENVDPFGRLPCRHRTVLVHITDQESMGEDLVECRPCGYAMRLADLYRGLFPPGGAIPGALSGACSADDPSEGTT